MMKVKKCARMQRSKLNKNIYRNLIDMQEHIFSRGIFEKQWRCTAILMIAGVRLSNQRCVWDFFTQV